MKKKLVAILLTGVMTCSLALAGCSKDRTVRGGRYKECRIGRRE